MAKTLYCPEYAMELFRAGRSVQFAFADTDLWLPVTDIGISDDGVASVRVLVALDADGPAEPMWFQVRAADSFREARS